MPAKSIGKTLKELRLKCGLSQKQAYEYIGVAQSTFSSWEVGKAEPPNEVFYSFVIYIMLMIFFQHSVMTDTTKTGAYSSI